MPVLVLKRKSAKHISGNVSQGRLDSNWPRLIFICEIICKWPTQFPKSAD